MNRTDIQKLIADKEAGDRATEALDIYIGDKVFGQLRATAQKYTDLLRAEFPNRDNYDLASLYRKFEGVQSCHGGIITIKSGESFRGEWDGSDENFHAYLFEETDDAARQAIINGYFEELAENRRSQFRKEQLVERRKEELEQKLQEAKDRATYERLRKKFG